MMLRPKQQLRGCCAHHTRIVPTQVGAGTMNPATYLRVNGPEPWNVCYVEPSIRPDDSRYGLNPNRLQRHTQVINAMLCRVSIVSLQGPACGA